MLYKYIFISKCRIFLTVNIYYNKTSYYTFDDWLKKGNGKMKKKPYLVLTEYKKSEGN